MTLEDIKKEMGKRLNDPDLTQFRGLVGNAFIQAICDLIAKGEYQPEDIPDLMVDDPISTTFDNWEATYTIPSETQRFLDVYLDTTDLMQSGLTLKRVDHSEVKRIQLEPAFAPSHTECFWYRVRDRVHFILSKDYVEATPPSWEFIMLYIKNPDPDDWTSEVDLIADKGYSRNFLYSCINKAVDSLRGAG
tara:strand:- start:88 stop:660 length:573 start_codon:yes stop_codon:yes gene_type:complete